MADDRWWWGTGWSDTVADGAAPASDRAAFTSVDDPDRPRRRGGMGFGARYADDLALLAGHGLGHLRLTFEWARLEPTPDAWDTAAVEHLTEVLDAANDAGIHVWACLHDGSLPGWFAHDEHGFVDQRSRRYFWARHVERVGEAFGGRVHGWVPTFEPTRWASRGWLDGDRPPGQRDDARGFAAAVEAAHLAGVEAAQVLRQGGRPVASAQWLVPVFPARSDPTQPPPVEAEVAAGVVDEVLRRSWLRLLTEETLVIPNRSPIPVPGAREAYDVIGFTYRHAVAVRGDGMLTPYPPSGPVGSDGQVTWAEGLAVAVHDLADALPDRDLLLAGVGIRTPDEGQREDYAREVADIVTGAVDGGIALRGAWWDPPISAAGGLFDPDRSPRPATARWPAPAGSRR